MAFPVVALAALAAEFAPSLVKHLFGDKAAEATEQVSAVVKRVTGTDDLTQATAVLRADPNKVLELQRGMAEIEADLEKAYLADRSDARSMSVERARVSAESAKADARRKNAMIAGDVLGLVVCLAVLVLVPNLPGEVRGIISTIAGVFGLGLRDAHQFEFGSSRGSADKSALLALK